MVSILEESSSVHCGKEGSGTLFVISQAIRYASGLPNVSGRVPTQKANVINMSLGGPGFSRTMADALAAGQSEGVVVVGSAGNNDSNELNYPASHEGVISVGATDLSGGKAPYSSFGSRIDVVAPGGNLAEDRNADEYGDGVLSTLWNEDRDEPLYRFYQGTSMAAPHVAGVVSLMLSVNPNLSPSQVRQILQETAIDLGPPGKDNTFGFGLIDPVAALKAAGALTPQNPQLVVSTKTMNFGDSLEQLTATISNGGGGTLQVNTPTVEMDQASNWLSAIVSGSTLIATVNRAGLNSGFYTGRIQLTSNGGNVTIEVQMQVGEEPQADVGTIFVIAVDPTTFETIEAISTSLDTDFTFEIPPVAAGVYFVIAGTDLDNDGFICDEGEFCGLYPVSNEASLVGVTANEITPNIDFTVEEDAFQNSTSMSESVNRQVGFRIFQHDADRFTLLKQRPNRLSSAELPLDVTGFEVVTEEE